MKKLTILMSALFISVTASHALIMPNFSGDMGLLGNITLPVSLDAQTYVAGQLDCGDHVLIRGEFAVNATNLQNLIAEPTAINATFNIRELSITGTFATTHMVHYITAFLGEYEPAGSDIFLKRQFGLNNMLPSLTESWFGVNGASAYPSYGIGGAYAGKIGDSNAIGVYVFKNSDIVTSSNSIATNLRLGTSLTNFCADVTSGMNFIYSTDTSFFSIDEISLHFGLTMLAGNVNVFCVFIEAGIGDFGLSTSGGVNLEADSIYLFIEPRVSLAGWQIQPSVFCLPFASIDKMIFLYYPQSVAEDSSMANALLGANLTVYNDSLYFLESNFTVGSHLTFGLPGTNLLSIAENIASGNLYPQLSVSPFISVAFMGGNAKAAASIDLLNLSNIRTGALRFMIGFKTTL
ncbi:MAG: hypothetical protein IKQ43_07765 [Treponema sp.]|nr:hypothetical protein [Treponema sp.]MBR7079243.1 hypothetical protein [Treponema sp.]